MKKYTVTVGIPAHNEEANIIPMIKSVLAQKGDSFVLEKIIVLADGCTDNTEKKVISLAAQNSLVVLMASDKRIGKAERLNELYQSHSSDILVTLDADLFISDDHLIDKMMVPFFDKETWVVAGNGQPLSGLTFVEKITVAGEKLWYEARKNWKNGHNIYNSAGCVFALSQEFTRNMRFPKGTIAEQHFVYFGAVTNGKRFVFVQDALVYYRTPANFADFLLQAGRSISEQNITLDYLGMDWEAEYRLPFSCKLRAVIKSFVHSPILVFCVITLQILLRIIPRRKSHLYRQGLWEIATSTKKITIKNNQ